MKDQASEFEEVFSQMKGSNLGQVLIKSARLFNERALTRISAQAGVPSFRRSHLSMLAHIDFAGTRLTEIARRMDVSKQAVGQLINEMEQMGTVTRVPDPSDGRARLVRFTDEGKEQMVHGLNVLKDVERELAQVIGEARMGELHGLLVQLLAALEGGEARAALAPSGPTP
jgi:DNA-binding MarR family transcriptional regulator